MKQFFFFLGVGFIVGLIAAFIHVQGYLVPWQLLSDTPEKPQKIVAFNEGVWILTEENNIYHYSVAGLLPWRPNQCEIECWQKYEHAPENEPDLDSIRDCRMYSPSTSWLVDSISVCRHIGFATIAFVIGIDKNGNIFSWSHSIGDTDYWTYFIFPYRIGITVVLVSVVRVLTKDAYRKLRFRV